MKYSHTQIGKTFIGILILAVVVSIISITTEDFKRYSPDWMDTTNWDITGIIIVCVVYLIVLNMSTLTVKIDKELLRWYFGVGIPRKTIQLADIESIKQVRNKWFFGFGIRKLVTGGWLYNVHGLDAVEVKTRFGKIVRIGTDDPKGLVRALSTAVEKARGEAYE